MRSYTFKNHNIRLNDFIPSNCDMWVFNLYLSFVKSRSRLLGFTESFGWELDKCLKIRMRCGERMINTFQVSDENRMFITEGLDEFQVKAFKEDEDSLKKAPPPTRHCCADCIGICIVDTIVRSQSLNHNAYHSFESFQGKIRNARLRIRMLPQFRI